MTRNICAWMSYCTSHDGEPCDCTCHPRRAHVRVYREKTEPYRWVAQLRHPTNHWLDYQLVKDTHAALCDEVTTYLAQPKRSSPS